MDEAELLERREIEAPADVDEDAALASSPSDVFKTIGGSAEITPSATIVAAPRPKTTMKSG